MNKKALILWILLFLVLAISVFGYLYFKNKKEQKVVSDKELAEKRMLQELEDYQPIPNPKTEAELINELDSYNANMPVEPIKTEELINQLENFNSLEK
jgi:hypothetical protein